MIPSHTHILPPFERVDFSQPGGAGYGFATRESRRAGACRPRGAATSFANGD
jgi:hypothetical protein